MENLSVKWLCCWFCVNKINKVANFTGKAVCQKPVLTDISQHFSGFFTVDKNY